MDSLSYGLVVDGTIYFGVNSHKYLVNKKFGNH